VNYGASEEKVTLSIYPWLNSSSLITSFSGILNKQVEELLAENGTSITLCNGINTLRTEWYVDLKIGQTQLVQYKFYDGIGLNGYPTDGQWKLALKNSLPDLLNYNLWFILNEKDSFYYWQEYNNDKIEKVYQEYLDTLKSIKSSVLTTIEPKILVDFAKMKLITVNIDNTNITRKIKRIFLEKLKIFNNLYWFFEDNKKWNKFDNSNKIEEIYQIYISYKAYFSKNPIFYLRDDTFIDFKNMVIIIKGIKKNIKRE
jgi:hypothetical protein